MEYHYRLIKVKLCLPIAEVAVIDYSAKRHGDLATMRGPSECLRRPSEATSSDNKCDI